MGVEKKSGAKVSRRLKPSDYVHLHNHTHHSLLDGLTKIPDLVRRTKEMGMTAVAVTDHGTMSGIVEFYKEALDSGIKPILGMEAYVAARSRFDRDPAKDKQRYHLTILAMNDTGYHNLMILASKANLEGLYYKPRIDHELLEIYNEGLIILSGCASGELGESLRAGDYDGARAVASWYQSVFGDRYYLELQDHGHPESPSSWEVQRRINDGLERLSHDLGIPMVVTSDGHYLSHDDQDAHEILLCVGTGAYLSESNRMSLKDFELHLTDPAELVGRWQKTNPEAVMNTRRIAERCNVTLDLGKILIPKFPVPDGEDEKSFLHKLVFRGLAVRYGGRSRSEVDDQTPAQLRSILTPEVLERVDMELEVMDKMGYNGYFLIVQDFINWGKSQGIIFGPGRGSAAGSIVAYALNITDLDPLKYDLLFERFLNPDRISMPDIDIDIQDTRRDEVIAYCANKYGDERVANIVTFGKMAARAAVRDVARVLEVPYAEADRLSKMIPPPVQGRHIPLAESVKADPDLKREYQSNPTAKRVFDYAIRLEGTIRSHGVHAAGVVIAPDDLMKFVPLEMAQKGVVATQYPMGPVEELGLLKMDFLGLANLTIINNALRIVKKVYGQTIDLSTVPLDDLKTFTLFQNGETTGVFQFESAGMKRYLRELRPTVFDDIIAMVALYRPGPMQFIDSFIKRKHGEEPITYLHPALENSLKNTYGILVYQEQFMQVSKEWCGFTGGQADTLRKAVGKKKIDLMRKVKVDFIEGAVNVGGADKAVAEKFWQQLEEFANYCFNKSHAACYALIAYWTAYLKAHFPAAFMAALMTSDQDDSDRLAIEINECLRLGIKVLPPDVNESFVEFSVTGSEKPTIRFGLAAIKGVGVGAVEELLRAREAGVFSGVEDFARRVDVGKVNRKAWESMVKAGAFDAFADRSDMLFNLDNILSFASKLQKEALSGQTDLFAMIGDDAGLHASLHLQPAPSKYTDREQLAWERELLGLYLSAHPLDNYDVYFAEQAVRLSEVSADYDGQNITVGGLISNLRTIVTKNGSKMAFVAIEDKTGEIEAVVFPKLYEEAGLNLARDAVVRISGRVSSRDASGRPGEIKIMADELVPISDDELRNYQPTGKRMSPSRSDKKSSSVSVKASNPQSRPVASMPVRHRLFVRVMSADDQTKLTAIKGLCTKYPGLDDIVLVIGADKQSAIRLPFRIDPTDDLIGGLVKILGEDSVKLV